MCECIEKLRKCYKENIIQYYEDRLVDDSIKVEIVEQVTGINKDIEIEEHLVINVKSTYVTVKRNGPRLTLPEKREWKSTVKVKYCPLCGEQQH